MSEQPTPGVMLSDWQILERLVATDDRCIFVSPLIDAVGQLGPSSLDLHLGHEVSAAQTIESTHIDLTASKDEIRRQMQLYMRPQRVMAGKIVLHPGNFVLAHWSTFDSLGTSPHVLRAGVQSDGSGCRFMQLRDSSILSGTGS